MLVKFTPTFDTCGAATIAGFPPWNECEAPQFVAFYITIARLGPCALKMPSGLITVTSDVFFGSSRNIARASRRWSIVC